MNFAKILSAGEVDGPRIIAPVGTSIPTLERLGAFSGRPGPVVLVILDGFGIGKGDETDAIHVARTPNLDRLNERKPSNLATRLAAHGPAVGLPGEDDMGNSEVGHNAIGAGRRIEQGASIIRNLIGTGEFQGLPRLNKLINNVLHRRSTFHLIGLLQTSGVHAHFDHVKAMVEAAHHRGVKKIRVHALSDGRDDPSDQTLPLMRELVEFLDSFINKGECDYQVASGGGRMWMTMDRYEANWGMVERGWNAHVHGRAELRVRNALAGIGEGRKQSHTSNPDEIDQFLPSYVVVDESGVPIGRIQDEDSVVFWNFRGDRAMEISRAFEEEDFSHFDRGRRPNVKFAGMMLYDGDRGVPQSFIVEMPRIVLTAGEILAHNGVPQIAGAEAQKHGHVTYFFNGNFTGPFDKRLERYFRVESDDPSLFASRPHMQASQVTEMLLTTLRLHSKTKFIRVNYANPDMVGHTGNFAATVRAIEVVDAELGRLMMLVESLRGILIVTADHGNADEMIKKGKPSNSHSINPVPFVIYDPLRREGDYQLDSGISAPTLSNIAPTLFTLAGFRSPQDMERSLIIVGT